MPPLKMPARQTRYGAYLFVYIVVVLAVLGAVNYLANQNDKSYDTTSNKRYSLSDQTKKAVANLKNDVTFDYVNRASGFPEAKTTLDRYQALSHKITVNYIDPVKSPDRARAMGIRTIPTLVVTNGTRHEEAKSLMEDEVTGALIRSTKNGPRNICFVNGSGEHRLDDTEGNGYSGLKDALEHNNYTTRVISLIEKPEIPKDCNVTVIAGPHADYAEPMVNAVKNYVTAGGHAFFLLDPPTKGFTGDPSLSKLLAEWGVTPEADLVLDLSATSAYFGEAVPFAVKYQPHPIVNGTDVATAYPLARSLDVKAPSQILFTTSADSYAVTHFESPVKLDPKTARKGPFTLGAAGTVGSGPTQGRFVVIGSSSAAANQILGVRQVGNRDLILNTFNWLTADEDLISIRPKDPDDRRINLSGRQLATLFYLTLIALPLIIIGSGFMTWWKRR
ncbi:MAG TPA: hypothetical protein DEQ47_07920 [Solibacterales bacterium]|nr:hypothetical protein [Bryobacterales bacterium]